MHSVDDLPRLFVRIQCAFATHINPTIATVVYGAGASFTALDVLFSDNEAITGGDGGAVSVHGGTATFTQCSFVGNKAHDWGGALYFTGRAVTTITVTDCTFVSNYADCEGWDEPEDCGADVFTSTTDITLTCSADGCGDDGTFGDTACTKLYEGDSQEKFLCTPTCASCASCGEAPLGAALAVAQACGGSCNDQVESALGLACSCGGGATGATGTAADIISESTDTCGCTAPAGCSGGGGSGSGSGGDDEPCTGADCPCEGAACDTTCSVDNVSQDITFTIVGFENHGLSASDAEVGLQNFMRQNTDDNDADVTVSASGEVTMRVTRCPDEVVTEANVVDALNDALGTTAGEWAITNLEVSDSDSAATAAASMLALVVVVAAAAATLR